MHHFSIIRMGGGVVVIFFLLNCPRFKVKPPPPKIDYEFVWEAKHVFFFILEVGVGGGGGGRSLGDLSFSLELSKIVGTNQLKSNFTFYIVFCCYIYFVMFMSTCLAWLIYWLVYSNGPISIFGSQT